ncbi:MAG: ATP-binding protein [Acidobacteriota bacterium]
MSSAELTEVIEQVRYDTDMPQSLYPGFECSFFDEISEEMLFNMFDMVPAGISVSTDPTCRIIKHNPLAASFLRIPPWQNLSHSSGDSLSFKMSYRGKEMMPEEMPIQQSFWFGNTIHDQEIDFIWDDGVIKTAVMNSRPIYNINSDIVGVIATFEDITQRKLLENNLLKSNYDLLETNIHLETRIQERTAEIENAYQTTIEILESITDAFLAVNHDWQVIYFNKVAEELTNTKREDVLTHNLWSVFPILIPTPFYHYYTQAMNERKHVVFESQGAFSDQWFEVRIYPSQHGLSIYYHDITERKQMEKEIARLDRLNLVGEMAAGFGHEIRNPMTAIRGFVQMLSGYEECCTYKEYFDLIVEELDRANSIIKDFLSLARDRKIDVSIQDLNNIVHTLYPIISSDALGSDKTVLLDLNDIPLLLLDGKEIRQLILNLIRNGLEAMPPGKTLKIRTELDGDDVVLSVIDQGSGIKPDIVDKLGTPFFTTKENGTGLGLAVCYSIANRHNAQIKMVSDSTGTTISVRFKTARSSLNTAL